MHLINQPYNESIGSLLISNLNQDFNTFKFIVAYAKLSGVRHLIEPINSFKSRNGQATGIIGIDQHNTSLEAIQELFYICDELYIFHSENITQTFHPKVYYFESNNKIWFSSGSSNMTSGGLFTNYETNIYDEITLNSIDSTSIYSDIQQLFNTYTDTTNPCCLRVTQELINTLLDNGYIYPEESINRIRLSRENSSNSHQRLFGSERFNAPSLSNNITQYSNEETSTLEILTPSDCNMYSNILSANSNNSIDTYDSVYGTYDNFIQLIDGFAKNYYYIPQGVHLGHIFYIIKSLGDGNLDYRLTLFNNSTTGPNGSTVRQTNYKVASCMELMLLEDYRLPNNINNPSFSLQLTNNGYILYDILNNTVNDSDFYDFYSNSNTTWRMVHNNPDYYIDFIRNMPSSYRCTLYELFNNLTIFRLLVNYVSNHTTGIINISELYNDFWISPSVVAYLNSLDFSTPAQSSLEHRIPFLISLLKSFYLVDSDINDPSRLIRL